jgi:hypothetical protein
LTRRRIEQILGRIEPTRREGEDGFVSNIPVGSLPQECTPSAKGSTESVMTRKVRGTDSRLSPSLRERAALSGSPVFTPAAPKPLDLKRALTSYTNGIYDSRTWGSFVAKPITDVTLSGALMNADSAWLEVGGKEVRVYGDTGQIHWFKNSVPSDGAWLNAYLPGMEAGATYVGQIRCFAGSIPAHQYHIALKLVYPDRYETSYIPVVKSSFIVPFAFISVAAQQSMTPHVQFFPEYLSHCVVYDVHVKKV